MLCDTLEQIYAKIADAAQRSGRTPDSVGLVAVSKRQEIDAIRRVISCGQQVFGENYLQEAREKIAACQKEIRWHFIGHLQGNKVRTAVEIFDVIETVDTIKTARLIDRYAGILARNPEILLQVNIGKEKQKHGVLPEKTEALLSTIRQETQLRVSGLMALPPWFGNPEDSRPYFIKLRQLAEQLSDKGLFTGAETVKLSMGMSADYTIAIEEGATLVRVGTALFGPRK